MNKTKEVVDFCGEMFPDTFMFYKVFYDYKIILYNTEIAMNEYKEWSKIPLEKAKYLKGLLAEGKKYKAKAMEYGYKEDPIDWNKKYEETRRNLK